MKLNLNALLVFAGVLIAGSAVAQTPAANPALANLSGAQVEALRQAVCFAEPADTVRSVFGEIATAPAGSSQQDLMKSRLSAANLSFFCMTGALNRDGAAAGYEYGSPAVEQIAQSSMRIIELGTVVTTADIKEIRWDAPAESLAQGRFTFDTGTGYKGACLFRAQQDGETWKIVQLAIQKTGSDKLEDGHPVF